MAEHAGDFQLLMQRLRDGDDEAARELFDHYRRHLSIIVRNRLAARYRNQYDSLDFLQAVWASFFALSPEDYRFEKPDDLKAFLSRLACNKVIDAVRRRQSRKQGAERERPIIDDQSEALPDDRPTPSQEVIAEERWQELLAGLDGQHRRALEMLRLGHSYGSVSRATGLHPKAIQRWL